MRELHKTYMPKYRKSLLRWEFRFKISSLNANGKQKGTYFVFVTEEGIVSKRTGNKVQHTAVEILRPDIIMHK